MYNQIFYQYHIRDVEYYDDLEYRKWLRKLFCMTPPKDLDTDLDEITMDENNYDEEAAKKAMDSIYENTHKHPVFRILYEKAAGCMLSMDNEIGLAVLFSYDYMAMFHKCIQRFFESSDEFNEECNEYKQLHAKLT